MIAAKDTDKTYAKTVASLTHFLLVFAAIFAFLSPVYVAGFPRSILGMKSLSLMFHRFLPLYSATPSVLTDQRVSTVQKTIVRLTFQAQGSSPVPL